ncbi:MAG: pentapeptide repeat-containing protein [Deltaproteobacteria bacterium]|nr:pentapeptide repeat-containing protein [Deltaproteobacteria bacterium]
MPEEKIKQLLHYLQLGRDILSRKPYSLVFWVSPEFHKRLALTAPDFYHWIFGIYDFDTPDILPEVLTVPNESYEIKSVLLNKMSAYLKRVVWQYRNREKVKHNDENFLIEPMGRADLNNYYVQSYCIDKEENESLLDKAVEQFLDKSSNSFLTLLGDFGTGKSSFSLHYFVELAEKYLQDETARIPIFISLKDYQQELNLEDFIIREVFERLEIEVSLPAFQDLALAGKFVFFMDGFDELASLSDNELTCRNLKELTKLSFENTIFMTTKTGSPAQANKIILTCRTHAFPSEEQIEHMLRGVFKTDYATVYRDYINGTDFEITRLYLKEFNEDQVREYVRMVTDDSTAQAVLELIDDIYDLKGLSKRPLLLEMIIETLQKLKDEEKVNVADLYRTYTDQWIQRDDWRSHMTPVGKRAFMWQVATKMFKEGGSASIHYSKLDRPDVNYIEDRATALDDDYYKYEITTCAFLNRDKEGNYKFIHKSFQEYFIAECFFDRLRNKTNDLGYADLNSEIRVFLSHIVSFNKTELSGLNMSGFRLDDTDLANANLKGADMSRADLCDADLNGANLNSANLRYADLRRAKLDGADLSGVDLSDTNLSDVVWIGLNLQNSNLSTANLMRAALSGADLKNTNLRGASLKGADLNDANLRGTDLSNAYLTCAKLNRAKLDTANLNGADLNGAELIKAGLSGADLRGADLRGADLSYAHLTSARLIKADLTGADLTGADLSGADLSGLDLRGVNLEGIILAHANLNGANLRGCKLNKTNLNSARLNATDLSRADLREADLAFSDLRETNLRGANLRHVVGWAANQLLLARTDRKTKLPRELNHLKENVKKSRLQSSGFEELDTSNQSVDVVPVNTLL